MASRISCPGSKFELAPPLDELDGPDEELQRRAEGVAKQLLALTVATCLDVAGVFRQLLTVPYGHVKSEEASKAEYELHLFPDVRLFLLCTCRHRLAGG